MFKGEKVRDVIMCFFCGNNNDVGWLRRGSYYYSVCYGCGLKEEGEYTDRIPTDVCEVLK